VTWLSQLGTQLRDFCREHIRSEEGASTTEAVIWIAFLAGLALTIIGIFRPEIIQAARSVHFK